MINQLVKFKSITKSITFILLAITLTWLLFTLLKSSHNVFSKPEHINYNVNYAYLIDKTNSFHETDVINNENFINAAANEIPFSLGDVTYWIKLTITNEKSVEQQLVLHADNAMLTTFDIYTLTNNATQLIQSQRKQPTDGRVFPHININLNELADKHFLLKIKPQGPPNVPLTIYEKTQFEQQILLTKVIYVVFATTILLMSIYNLVIYSTVRDKVYLAYVAYLLSSFFVLLSINGIGYFFLPDYLQNWLNNITLSLHYLVVLSLLTFTLFFLRYDKLNNMTYKVSLFFCSLFIILAISSVFIEHVLQATIFFSLLPLFYLLAIFIIVQRLKKDFIWARFYFLSWIPLLAGAIIQPLVLLNFLEYSFITRNAFLLAVIIEISFMAFALAERMRRNEEDRMLEISYHLETQIPRKIALETTIAIQISKGIKNFSIILIKPEQIEKIIMYIDDINTHNLYQRLYNKLASLFVHNDAILPLTHKNEKISLIENNCLAIILATDKQIQPVKILVNSIQEVINEHYYINDLKLPLSGVIGIAHYPEHGISHQQLIHHAQFATVNAELLLEKWCFYENKSNDQAQYLLKLASDIVIALEQEDFEIYHQPQMDLKTLRVCGSECLIRWPHDIEGFIPPELFIPLAEDMGLINQITLWVISRSLSQHHVINKDNAYNHMVSINISGRDIEAKGFYSNVVTVIEESNISADKIIFEITESSAIINNKQALDVIEKLASLGITISIDDFGTGYSSLAYINKLPFQELKVDRLFVEDICDNPKHKIIAENTVKMAKDLGLEVVAEGINSQFDQDMLTKFGCDIGQGYFYAKAMPLKDYVEWLNNQVNGQVSESHYGQFIPAKKD